MATVRMIVIAGNRFNLNDMCKNTEALLSESNAGAIGMINQVKFVEI